MRKMRKWLSVMLAAALVTGSLQAPVYAAKVGGTAETAAEAEAAAEEETAEAEAVENSAADENSSSTGSVEDASESSNAATTVGTDDSAGAAADDAETDDLATVPDDAEAETTTSEQSATDAQSATEADGTAAAAEGDTAETETAPTGEDSGNENSSADATTAASNEENAEDDATENGESSVDEATAANTASTSIATEVAPVVEPGKTAEGADTNSGTCGDNLTWVLGTDGTLTISGTGAMEDYLYSSPWYSSRSSVTKIVVEEGVTTIGVNAFEGCRKTTSISLPDSLTSIGDYAFYYAAGPAVLDLPDGLTRIGRGAFYNMSGIEEISIPDSVALIGIDTFTYCGSLKKVTFGNGLVTIPDNMFYCNDALENVTLPASVKTIGDSAFYSCDSLTQLDLPANLQKIGSKAFDGCTGLGQISMPDSVTSIGTYAFNGCSSLSKASLSAGLTEIPDYAFNGCSDLTEVTIPDSVTAIGMQAFSGCTSLTEVVLPKNLTSIGDGAFKNCTNLSKVTLPADEYEAGENVFSGCASDLQYFDSNGQALSDVTVGEVSPAESDNKGDQNYIKYGSPAYSYILVDDASGKVRIEYSGGALMCEYYDADGALTGQKSIPVELPIFGGFLEGADNYYLIFGQENEEEDDTKEVIRVVCYSKDWVRQGAASVCGANTRIPFDAGSASLTESGGMLYLRTCHEMYKNEKGEIHQSNMTVSIRKSDMTVTSTRCEVSYVGTGYVSHSFNQIMKEDGSDIVAVDHGDAYPRGFVLFKYEGKAGAESLGAPKYVIVLSFGGETGDNYTGASLGSLEISDTHYLVAGNSVVQDGDTFDSGAVRNIFVTATSKNDFTESGTSMHWVTSYTGSESVSTPVMTALPDGKYLLMWTVDDVLNFCYVGSDGTPENTIYTGIGSLSDCRPYYKNNGVWWYVTSSTAPVYYYIDLDDPGVVRVLNASHTLVLDPMGGTLDTTEMTVEHGSQYGELPTPTRDSNYEFLGWYTGKNTGTKVTSTTSVRVRNSETLYARWRENWSFNDESGTLKYQKPGIMGNCEDQWSDYKGKLKNVVIGDGVTAINGNEFYKYSTLKTAVIASSVIDINGYAFYGTGLTDVYYLGTESEWNAIEIDSRGNSKLTGANIHFVDDARSLEYAQITGLTDTNYTGSAIEQEITVMQLGDILTQNSDYTVSYSDNVNAGTATVTVTGKGSYHDSVSGTFTIKPISIASASVTGLGDQTYTGKALKPAPAVAVDGNTLTADTDYTVEYSNNTDAGTAEVTITGKGNCTGTVTGTFTIKPASIASASVTGLDDAVYTGAALKPVPVVKLGSVTLKSGTDYTVAYSDNVNAGKATVTVTGCGNYADTATGSFTIEPASIASATVSGLSDKTYTGSELTQTPVVKLGSATLKADVDYEVSYTDNTAVGTATVKVTGCGNYTGTASGTFAIKATSIASASVTGIEDAAYTGAAIKPVPAVKLGSVTLKSGTDYEVSYKDNTEVGTATVTITGKGNYTGTVRRTFKITPHSIASAEVTGLENKTYTGSAIEQEPEATVDGLTLTAGTDYTVAYADNTAVGTATVTISGIGNYSGTVSASFEIEPASIASATVSGLSDKTFTGSEITQDPVVKLGSTTLEAGTDYTVSYEGNTWVGTATVTITGCGNYTGKTSGTFKITQAPIDKADVTGLADKEYTGSAVTQQLTVSVDGYSLTQGTDYTVSYADNTEVGTATVTITGRGNYTGALSHEFKIVPASISSAVITGLESQTYTGSAIEQMPVVRMNGNTLVLDQDYTVAFSDNINAGSAIVKITGKGNYTGTAVKMFNINPLYFGEDADVTAVVGDIADVDYCGKALTPEVTVTVGEVTLAANTDYAVAYSDNVNIGTATVKVIGRGNYTGSVTKTFEILPIDISGAVVSGLTDQGYTGEAITPVPVLMVGDAELKSGKDFTIEYSDNVEIGEVTMIIKGCGNCKGELQAVFNIVKGVQPLKVNPVNSTVVAGARLLLSVTGNKGDVTFASSNTAAAKVAADGRVTSVGAGVAVITVTAAETDLYNEASATMNITVLPAATQSLKAQNLATGIKLTWKKVAGATGYAVYRGKTQIATIGKGTTVTYTDKKATKNGGKYTYKIVAKAATGNSAAKAVTTYRLARPAVKSLKNTASKKATVKWSKNSKGTGYQIQYATNKKFTKAKSVWITKKASVSKVLAKLTKGKKYYVRIRTYKKVGKTKYYSAWSKTKAVKIKK